MPIDDSFRGLLREENEFNDLLKAYRAHIIAVQASAEFKQKKLSSEQTLAIEKLIYAIEQYVGISGETQEHVRQMSGVHRGIFLPIPTQAGSPAATLANFVSDQSFQYALEDLGVAINVYNNLGLDSTIMATDAGLDLTLPDAKIHCKKMHEKVLSICSEMETQGLATAYPEVINTLEFTWLHSGMLIRLRALPDVNIDPSKLVQYAAVRTIDPLELAYMYNLAREVIEAQLSAETENQPILTDETLQKIAAIQKFVVSNSIGGLVHDPDSEILQNVLQAAADLGQIQRIDLRVDFTPYIPPYIELQELGLKKVVEDYYREPDPYKMLSNLLDPADKLPLANFIESEKIITDPETAYLLANQWAVVDAYLDNEISVRGHIEFKDAQKLVKFLLDNKIAISQHARDRLAKDVKATRMMLPFRFWSNLPMTSEYNYNAQLKEIPELAPERIHSHSEVEESEQKRKDDLLLDLVLHEYDDDKIEYYLSHGADVNTRIIGSTDYNGTNALWWCMAERKFVHAWNVLLDEYDADVNVAATNGDYEGTTPLWWAVKHSEWLMVRYLLVSGANVLAKSEGTEMPGVTILQQLRDRSDEIPEDDDLRDNILALAEQAALREESPFNALVPPPVAPPVAPAALPPRVETARDRINKQRRVHLLAEGFSETEVDSMLDHSRAVVSRVAAQINATDFDTSDSPPPPYTPPSPIVPPVFTITGISEQDWNVFKRKLNSELTAVNSLDDVKQTVNNGVRFASVIQPDKNKFIIQDQKNIADTISLAKGTDSITTSFPGSWFKQNGTMEAAHELMIAGVMESLKTLPPGCTITIGNCKGQPIVAKKLADLAAANHISVVFDKHDGTEQELNRFMTSNQHSNLRSSNWGGLGKHRGI